MGSDKKKFLIVGNSSVGRSCVTQMLRKNSLVEIVKAEVSNKGSLKRQIELIEECSEVSDEVVFTLENNRVEATEIRKSRIERRAEERRKKR